MDAINAPAIAGGMPPSTEHARLSAQLSMISEKLFDENGCFPLGTSTPR